MHAINLTLDGDNAFIYFLLFRTDQQSINCARELLGQFESKLCLNSRVFRDELHCPEKLSKSRLLQILGKRIRGNFADLCHELFRICLIAIERMGGLSLRPRYKSNDFFLDWR